MNIKKIISAHKFFVKETPSFVGKWVETSESYKGVRFGYYKIPFKSKLYYPIAYLKFMYYTLFNK